MKIYFAGSIRGGRDDQELYFKVIEQLKHYGTVLTEHLGDANLKSTGEAQLTDGQIFERDKAWVEESDVVVAEVTHVSMGVGYELGLADGLGKKVLCLRREQEGKRLSAMINGNAKFQIIQYETIEQLEPVFKKFFQH